MDTPKHLKEILQRLPRKPGVYQHYDKEGKLLYVGKAKDLKNRVSSYFSKQKYESSRTRLLVRKIADVKYIVVETEQDALLLENSLIKKYQPRYNVQLKDDKTYPWIVIRKERFPRVYPTRNMVKDGSEYFGPYASVRIMKSLLELIRQLYPLRTCKYILSQENINAGKFRVCLEYHLGNCLGPCEDRMKEEDYNENIQSIRQILRGNISDLIRNFKEIMVQYSENYLFEQAEDIRKKVEILSQYQAKSTIVNTSIHNVDVFSLVSDPRSGYVNYMKINNGAIVQSHTLELRKKLDESDEELLELAITEMRQRYNSTSTELYLPFELPGFGLRDARIHIPQRGDKKKLLELSARNSFYYMKDKQKQLENLDPEANQKRILETLKADLRLKELPIHIECFDNSNIQGTNPASACVVFKNAKPSKNDYRKFNIKTVEGPNDFASMEEVVYRRYKRLSEEGESLPQLVIIDGGKGQLSSALKAIDELGLRGKLTLIGIAKRLEEIYFPGDSLPLYIDKKSESLKLIQNLRNEAHRFSLSHHRDRRSKSALQTELTAIAGIGKATAEKLLRAFGSVTRVSESSIEELEKIIGKKNARAVFNYYSKSTN